MCGYRKYFQQYHRFIVTEYLTPFSEDFELDKFKLDLLWLWPILRIDIDTVLIKNRNGRSHRHAYPPLPNRANARTMGLLAMTV